MIKEKLFLKWWKFIWSFKFEKCINCWTRKFKHKSKGLCTSCFDKKRSEEKEYKKKRKIKDAKYEFKNKILWNLNKEKNMNKNKKIIFYKKEVEKMKEKWKIPLKMYIWEKLIELPFENLDRPRLKWTQYSWKKERFKEKNDKYEEEIKKYRKKLKIFYLISNYYKNEIQSL